MAKKKPTKKKVPYVIRLMYADFRNKGLTKDEIETLFGKFYITFHEDDSFDAPAKEVIQFFCDMTEYANKQETEEEMLAHEGWSVECRSPLEIRHKDGDLATGQAARLVIDHICRG